MKIDEAYNQWAGTYDEMLNKTRDLEAVSFRETLKDLPKEYVLEMGCGTGKNTAWLETEAGKVLAVDFSTEMLGKARKKIQAAHISFQQANMTQPWDFTNEVFDLVSFSLVLEHIEDLGPVISEAYHKLKPGGYIYISELHPFKQYQGSKARFETGNGVFELDCYLHYFSDYFLPALDLGLEISLVKEWFDEEGDTKTPRLLTMLFRK